MKTTYYTETNQPNAVGKGGRRATAPFKSRPKWTEVPASVKAQAVLTSAA